jgi:hypothetical protein
MGSPYNSPPSRTPRRGAASAPSGTSPWLAPPVYSQQTNPVTPCAQGGSAASNEAQWDSWDSSQLFTANLQVTAPQPPYVPVNSFSDFHTSPYVFPCEPSPPTVFNDQPFVSAQPTTAMTHQTTSVDTDFNSAQLYCDIAGSASTQ